MGWIVIVLFVCPLYTRKLHILILFFNSEDLNFNIVNFEVRKLQEKTGQCCLFSLKITGIRQELLNF